MNWRLFIKEGDLADLLSDEYARFAAAVQEGIVGFLSRLSEDIQNDILLNQSKLGKDATFPQRLGQLARCSPVLHKLGQILARNHQLASALRFELQKLEWMRPQLSMTAVQEILQREVGPLEGKGIVLAANSLAEASVAVVIPFARTDTRCTGNTPRFDGVFKLLKPGIEERLHRELEVLQAVGNILDGQCEDLNLPAIEYREIFSQVAGSLQNEVLLEQEQRNLLEAAGCFAHDPQIQIPRLLEPCSPRVTAMERIRGSKLDSSTIDSSSRKRWFAALAIKTLVVRPVLLSSRKALFHGDPHAGNLFHTENGRLALLDWSLAGHLSILQRRAISQIMLNAFTLRTERIAAFIDQLAEGPVRESAGLRRAVDRSLQSIRSGRLPGFSWLVKLLDAAVVEAKIRLPANILLFRKALMTITELANDLSGDHTCTDRTVLLEFMHVFAAEWPWRLLCAPYGLDMTTHLSNADLLEASMAIFALIPQTSMASLLQSIGFSRQCVVEKSFSGDSAGHDVREVGPINFISGKNLPIPFQG